MKICDLYYLMFVCVSVSLYAQGVALGSWRRDFTSTFISYVSFCVSASCEHHRAHTAGGLPFSLRVCLAFPFFPLCTAWHCCLPVDLLQRSSPCSWVEFAQREESRVMGRLSLPHPPISHCLVSTSLRRWQLPGTCVPL